MTILLGKGQGQVKQCHQMKMLHESRATYDLWVIWNLEYNDSIHFWI